MTWLVTANPNSLSAQVKPSLPVIIVAPPPGSASAGAANAVRDSATSAAVASERRISLPFGGMTYVRRLSPSATTLSSYWRIAVKRIRAGIQRTVLHSSRYADARSVLPLWAGTGTRSSSPTSPIRGTTGPRRRLHRTATPSAVPTAINSAPAAVYEPRCGGRERKVPNQQVGRVERDRAGHVLGRAARSRSPARSPCRRPGPRRTV
jgi:hypothetical protein